MLNYLLKRLASGLVLLVLVCTCTFALIFGGTDNVARNVLGEQATAADIAAFETELGLDQPLPVQYGRWVSGAVQGDFGDSWIMNQRVSDALSSRLPVTLSIVGVAILIMMVVSSILGMTAAVRRGLADRVIQVISVAGFAMPNFWLGLILVVVFGVNLGWFPPTGYISFGTSPSGWVMSLVLPVAALVFSGIASASQQVRGAVIDALRQDYVRTLRARGVRWRSILYKHALRNALPAALTVLSVQFIALLGGAAIIERVFAIPGLGQLTVDAALQGDIPVLMGVVVTLIVVVICVNLLIDILNAWINPKVRLQ